MSSLAWSFVTHAFGRSDVSVQELYL